jgi:hypothetical protein
MPNLALALVYGIAVAGCVVLVLHGHPWLGVLVLISGAGARITTEQT